MLFHCVWKPMCMKNDVSILDDYLSYCCAVIIFLFFLFPMMTYNFVKELLKYCIQTVYSYASSPGLKKKNPVYCAVVKTFLFPCECAVTVSQKLGQWNPEQDINGCQCFSPSEAAREKIDPAFIYLNWITSFSEVACVWSSYTQIASHSPPWINFSETSMPRCLCVSLWPRPLCFLTRGCISFTS